MQKKKNEKNVVFCQTPLGPPPSLAFFQKKKLPPFFLLKIASIMAETNFTFGQQNLFIYSYYNGPILP